MPPTVFDFISDNLPIFLSSLVSLAAVFTTWRQIVNQRKIKIMELYFEAQFKAYMEFYDLVTSLEYDLNPAEKRDIRPLIKAGKIAELISPHNLASAIGHFCATYQQYLYEKDTDGLTRYTEKMFQESLNAIGSLIREEMFRHDTVKRKTDRIFKRAFPEGIVYEKDAKAQR